MTRDEASEILQLSRHASPAERAAQYDILRRQLEEKLAKAPTPGLREKYRASLKELEDAHAILAQSDDAASLPVLKKESAGAPAASPSTATASVPRADNPPSAVRNPQSPAKKSSKEFLLVAAIAVLVLAAGGWWVMKTRAENAEKARIAAEAKAAADKAAEAEKARLELVKVQLRTVLAEAKIAWEVAEREERDAERRASELRSELRGLRNEKPGQRAELERRGESAQRYNAWLRDYLLRHPLKIARAKLEELLQAGASKDAEADSADVRRLTQSLQADLAHHPAGEATLVIATNLPTANWVVATNDEKRTGVGPARLTGLEFSTRYTVLFSHPGWSDNTLESRLTIEPGREAKAEANFDFFRVTFKGIQPGDRVEVDTKSVQPLPDGAFASAKNVPGGNQWVVYRDGHLPFATQLLGRDSDAEVEVTPVPLEPRPLVDAYLAHLVALPPRKRVVPLYYLFQQTAANGVLPLKERNKLLRELRAAVEAEPLYEVRPGNQPLEIADALFDVTEMQLLTDRDAAAESARAAISRYTALPSPQILALRPSQSVLAAFPELARDYTRAARAAIEADSTAANSRDGYASAIQVYLADLLHGRAAEAAEWREAYLKLRPAENRSSTETAFNSTEKGVAPLQENLPLRSALATGNIAEFNRLAAQGVTFAHVQIISDLLAHGYEQEALALAAASDGSYLNTFSFHALPKGRMQLLEDYVGRRRVKDTGAQLRLVEFYAISGNLAKAKALYAKIEAGNTFKEERVIPLLQMYESDAARALMDDIEKNNPPTPNDRQFRLPLLLSAAKFLVDPARAQRLVDLAGGEPFRIPAHWLARIGAAREEIISGASSTPQSTTNWLEYYQMIALRAGHSGNLPYIGPDSLLPLLTHHLSTLNRPPRGRPTLTVPYARQTPPVLREGVFVAFPNEMRRAGLSGEAKISIAVDESGQATGYTVISAPHPAFAEAMFKAASAKGFSPALKLGKPVAGTYEMTRTFRL